MHGGLRGTSLSSPSENQRGRYSPMVSKDFSGLFDEDFKQVFIDRLLVGRRRQEAWRNILRRRIDGGNRRGHHLLQADCRLGFDNGAASGCVKSGRVTSGKVELGNLRHAQSSRLGSSSAVGRAGAADDSSSGRKTISSSVELNPLVSTRARIPPPRFRVRLPRRRATIATR